EPLLNLLPREFLGAADHQRAEKIARREILGQRLLIAEVERDAADDHLAASLLGQQTDLDAAGEFRSRRAFLEVLRRRIERLALRQRRPALLILDQVNGGPGIR